jgi:hypothetical protein
MPWRRIGCVYSPDGTRPWARSHAALPAPVQIEADVYRFFLSTRDEANRSHVSWVDIDLTSTTPRILREATEPVLTPGADGAFDDSGIGIGCVTEAEDSVRLYYMGWNLGVRASWRNAIGFASAPTPLCRFERFSAGPILDRSPEDPYTLSYPWVLRRGTHAWWMWYGSNLTPNTADGMKHVIKFCRSTDGINWAREGTIAINFATSDEYAIARPTVVNFQGGFLMCFSCRGKHYRIGSARSTDGLHWTRADEITGLDRSSQGWDSQMTCYPALFQHRGRLWLAYNGNGYGATGFGLAIWEDASMLNGVTN